MYINIHDHNILGKSQITARTAAGGRGRYLELPSVDMLSFSHRRASLLARGPQVQD